MLRTKQQRSGWLTSLEKFSANLTYPKSEYELAYVAHDDDEQNQDMVLVLTKMLGEKRTPQLL